MTTTIHDSRLHTVLVPAHPQVTPLKKFQRRACLSDKTREEKFIDLFILGVLPRWLAGTSVSMAQASYGLQETSAGKEATVGLAPLLMRRWITLV